MVSLRRRRLLGLCSGLPNSSVVPFPMYFDDEGVAQFGTPPTNPISSSSTALVSSSMLGSSSPMQRSSPTNIYDSTSSQKLPDHPSPDQEAKLRRQYRRRKHPYEQERCTLRGVYCKNKKWQAAIKVDKKQIHLGTVGSQEEAARLYDRAAFMCGREPNFELIEEEMQELKRLDWDEFLEKTRIEISSKKTRRRLSGAGSQDNSELRVKASCDAAGRGAEGGLDGAASEVAELEKHIL